MSVRPYNDITGVSVYYPKALVKTEIHDGPIEIEIIGNASGVRVKQIGTFLYVEEPINTGSQEAHGSNNVQIDTLFGSKVNVNTGGRKTSVDSTQGDKPRVVIRVPKGVEVHRMVD